MIIFALIAGTIAGVTGVFPILAAIRFFLFHKNTELNAKNLLIATDISFWITCTLLMIGYK